MIETIIFDFDNTIANTNSIQEIRELGRYDQLTVETLKKVKLYKPIPALLHTLQERGIRLALVTNSGERYIEILLQHLNLSDTFEVVVTYGDVGRDGIKPSPVGLRLALERLGVAPSRDIIYIGDDNNDQLAAYKTGITPILPTWASRRPISAVPALNMSSEMVMDYIDNPHEYRLFAEQCCERKTAKFDRKGVYFLPLDDAGNIVTVKEEMTSFCLGRYYSQKGATTALLHDSHSLSLEIASKSGSERFDAPDYWIDLLAHVVRHCSDFVFDDGPRFDIITVIPGKRGKDPRLERILERVEHEINKSEENAPQFIPDILYYVEDALSQKSLARYERQNEANRALQVNQSCTQLVSGKRILIIDDVLTSGATLSRARQLLLSIGASNVMGVVLAKTVSIIEDERVCPECSRMMRVQFNKKIGTRFWGCIGFRDETNPCKHTEDLYKKDCPRCERAMRIKKNYRTDQKFWSCTGYNQTPNCNYTESIDPNEVHN